MLRVMGSTHPSFETGRKHPMGFTKGLSSSEHWETKKCHRGLDMVCDVAFLSFKVCIFPIFSITETSLYANKE